MTEYVAANAYNQIYVLRRRPFSNVLRAEDVEVFEVPDDARMQVRFESKNFSVYVMDGDDEEKYLFSIMLSHPHLDMFSESEARFSGFERATDGSIRPEPVEVHLARVVAVAEPDEEPGAEVSEPATTGEGSP